jgi:hypothetical protein
MKQQDDNSDYAVVVRREELAKKYLSGIAPQILFREYHIATGLSKASFDKDIQYVREQITVSVRDNFDNILNDTYTTLNAIISECLSHEDYNNALKGQKQIIDLLKLVQGHGNKHQVNIQNVQNNVNLPAMSVKEIRKLLGRTEL